MTTAIKRRRGTTAQHSTFTGLDGELTIDTTKKTVVVHDGATAGGIPLAKETGSDISATTLTTSGAVTHNGGTANGVTYLNASKVLTSGSALTFDGSSLGVNSVTVGRGAGAISTNTAVGASALATNTSGTFNTTLGYQAGQSITTALSNTAIGYNANRANLTGDQVTAIGSLALTANTAANNTAVGFASMNCNTSGSGSTALGWYSLYSNTTGAHNTALGYGSGSAITTGSKNTILGGYNGNQGGLDIRTADNYIVLSDGDGNPLISTAVNQTVALNGAVPNAGTGITFPATQVASANANTLDDYEEGTWTPTLTGTSGSATVSSPCPRYTKIGNLVMITATISYSSSTLGGQVSIGGFPFPTSSASGYRAAAVFGYASGLVFSGQLATDIPDNATSGPLIYLVSGSTPSNVGFGASGAFQFTYTYQTS